MTAYRLDLPDQPFLKPNDRPHWTTRHRLSQDWRDATAPVAKALGPVPPPVDVTLTMVPPDRRRRDPGSLALALKHCIDRLPKPA